MENDDKASSAAGPVKGGGGADDGRQMAWLIGAGLALLVAVITTMVALWPDADESSSAAAPADWPAASRRASDSPAAVPASTPAPSTSASPSSSPSQTKSPPPTTSAPANPTPTPGVPTGGTSRPPTLPPPPAADRTGTVEGGEGCLDVTGGTIIIGTGLAVRRCDGTSTQRWTLASDGTFRAVGLCAQSAGDAVRLQTCGVDGTLQWRVGEGGTLVNSAAGRCMTRSGSGVRLAACGADGQGWKLP
ncbi:ricin-type beta-trefoil lectin domain protein [Actinoplanes sp. NPDC051633]|uniref:ricin-type beta-trefoil lectin domain protein n=1 Tax=Actinoplanes sp. NPDC051633 TaxID=3155670 RepID=UPI0034449F11